MPQLVEPSTELAEQFRAARRDWGPGLHEDGFGIGADDDPDSPAGFVAWVEAVRRSRELMWWIVDDGEVVGGIALRPDDNELVQRNGHVGYGIRPSARGRGLATWAVRQVLAVAAEHGLDRLLAVCEVDNEASARTLERVGGRLEPPTDRTSAVRRYWIPTGGS